MQLFYEFAKQLRLPTAWFHGTNSELLPSIRKNGLRQPYLTDVREIAEQFAEATEGNGKPIIISLTVPDQNFSVDRPSLQEPLGYGGFTGKQMDRKVCALYRNRETIEDNEWKLTFPVTRTLRYNAVVHPGNIVKVETIRPDITQNRWM